MSKVKNKSEIYYRILELGVENLEVGLTLIELKEKLPQEFLQFDNTINSYFSILFQPVDETLQQQGVINYWGTSPNHLENLNNNKFRLTHELSIEFIKLNNSKAQIDLLQSQLNTLETQIRLAETNSVEAKKQSKSATNLAILAMIISAIMSIPDWIGLCNNTNSNELKDTQTAIQDATKDTRTLQYLTPEYLYQLDSVRMVNDSLRIHHFVGKTNLLEISKTLKYINQKLYKINKFNEQNRNK